MAHMNTRINTDPGHGLETPRVTLKVLKVLNKKKFVFFLPAYLKRSNIHIEDAVMQTMHQ